VRDAAKGGGAPGLLVLAYLATASTGQSYVTVLAENRPQPVDGTTILSAVKGALGLAARR
jgi:hypothetical protein